jgi:2-oxoglutarate/2-oxoacid ferredoxin oxidoreductase subunit alpha
MMQTITWKIGGEAGFGIMSSGIMLSKIFARLGYHVFCTNEYPSLIRGGLNLVTVRIGVDKVESMNRDLHILIALSKSCIETCKSQLNEDAIVIYDPKDSQWSEKDFPKRVKLIPVPLSELLLSLNAPPIMRNTITIGASLALLGTDIKPLTELLTEQFRKKGETVVKSNTDVAMAGFDYVKKTYPNETSMYMNPTEKSDVKLIINGSEALGVAAVRAGLKFAAIYPMTPINALISFLADHDKKLNLVYTQPEDEISGINMALGASVAGVRSMVATSGGGFALMVEGLSLAGMIETPLVIDLGMRVGPATGMPTWTEQGELEFVISAGHGEFPRIVLAPGDAEEIFQITVDAFHLADKYQIPVFILTDKYLNESQWCVPQKVYAQPVEINRGKLITENQPVEPRFGRYNLKIDDGISPRTIPGVKNGNFIANSYEHDETGLATEIPAVRQEMAEKRMKKWLEISKDIKPPVIYGNPDSQITFVNWGTPKGQILEAMKILAGKGISSNLVHITWLFPFPTQVAKDILTKSKRLILVEQNATGQLGNIIRNYTGITIAERILKFDGRPFFPEEIVERIKI